MGVKEPPRPEVRQAGDQVSSQVFEVSGSIKWFDPWLWIYSPRWGVFRSLPAWELPPKGRLPDRLRRGSRRV